MGQSERQAAYFYMKARPLFERRQDEVSTICCDLDQRQSGGFWKARSGCEAAREKTDRTL